MLNLTSRVFFSRSEVLLVRSFVRKIPRSLFLAGGVLFVEMFRLLNEVLLFVRAAEQVSIGGIKLLDRLSGFVRAKKHVLFRACHARLLPTI